MQSVYGLSQNENPDLPTRGMTVVQSSCSKIWWNGPKWLKRPEADWQTHPKNEVGTTLLMMVQADNEVTEYVEDIVDTPWTSKYHRTLKSVAWKLHWHESIKSTQPMMASEELQCARKVILKQVQRKFFLEGVKVTRKWPTSSAPVYSDVLTPRWVDHDGWRFATSGSDP